MANENPKNTADEPEPTNQESGKGQFQASIDKHGFKILVVSLFLLGVLCIPQSVLVIGALVKGGVLNDQCQNQCQTIIGTTDIMFFSVLITGIFIFMTFRIDRGAKSEAREVASRAAEETKQYATEEIKRVAEEAKRGTEEAKRDAEEAKRDAEEAKRDATEKTKQIGRIAEKAKQVAEEAKG